MKVQYICLNQIAYLEPKFTSHGLFAINCITYSDDMVFVHTHIYIYIYIYKYSYVLVPILMLQGNARTSSKFNRHSLDIRIVIVVCCKETRSRHNPHSRLKEHKRIEDREKDGRLYNGAQERNTRNANCSLHVILTKQSSFCRFRVRDVPLFVFFCHALHCFS